MANIIKPCGCDCASVTSPCGCDGASCFLTLPPPIGDPPYTDLTEATNVLANQTASCIGYVRDQGGLLTSFTADDSVPDTVDLDVVGNPDNAPSCQCNVWIGLSLLAGSTLSIAVSIGSFLGSTSNLYDDTGSLVSTDSGSGPHAHAISSTGFYMLEITGTSSVPGFGGGSDTFNFVVSSDDTMAACGIRAAYGGTPDYLVCV